MNYHALGETLANKLTDFFESGTGKNIVDTAGAGASVYNITGKSNDAGVAAGYGAWVNSITGKYPKAVKIEEGRARITLTPDQISGMQKWLDDMVVQSIKPGKEKPTLEVDFGPVVVPWAMRYAIPAGILIFAAGYLARWGMYG